MTVKKNSGKTAAQTRKTKDRWGNLVNFPKGKSGNPKGRPPKIFTRTLQEMRGSNTKERPTKGMVKEAYEFLLAYTEEELAEVVKDKKCPFILRAVAKSMLSNDGIEMIESILDRVHGKATQSVEANHTGTVTLLSLLTGKKDEPTDG